MKIWSGYFFLKYPYIFMFVLMMSRSAISGNTGKIAGRVVDSETRSPLIGANIVVEGTPYGAATDIEGKYFIINLPPNIYTVKITMIGYKGQKNLSVRIHADQTTQIDFIMKQSVIPGEEVVVVAEKEVVQMDISSATTVIEAQEIQHTPVGGNFDQVFMRIPGWGDYRTRKERSNAGGDRIGVSEGHEEDEGFQVRGGADWEVNMMIDGMSLKDHTSGYQFTKINLANIQEVQLLTGGYNAEYGEARSGVVNIITKEGEDQYQMSVDVKASPPGRKHWGPAVNDTANCVYSSRWFQYGPYLGFGDYWDSEDSMAVSFESTEMTGNRYFDGWLYIAQTSTPPEWQPLLQGEHHNGPATYEDTLLVANLLKKEWLWKHRPELWEYGDKWDYNIEATMSGPLPFVKSIIGTTHFFASLRTKYSEWMYPRAGGRNGGYNDYSAQFKLTNKPASNMKLNYNFLISEQWGGYEYRGGWRGEDFAFGRVLETPLQEFNQLGFGDFAEGWKENWNGVWMKPTYKRNHTLHSLQFNWIFSPKTFLDAGLQFAYHGTDLIQAKVRDTLLIPDEPYMDLNSNGIWDTGEQFEDTDGNGIWSAGEYANRIGIPGYWRYYDEAPRGRLPDVSSLPGNVKHLNWQDESFARTFTFKASITSQIDQHNQIKSGVEIIKNHEHVFRIKPKENGMVWYFDAEPLRMSGYIQNKLEIGGLIANIGMRLDGFDPEDWYYDFTKDPYNPIWGNHGPGNPLVQSPQDSLNRIAHYDGGNLNPESMPDSLMFNPPWQVAWSPRLGISHPIAENAKIFFNYGHFFQPVRSIYLYALHQRSNEGWKLREAGNPRLKMEKTVSWEVGYEHNIMNIFRVAVSGYYRRTSNERTRYIYHSSTNGNDDFVKLYSSRNDRYRDISGFEIKLDKRIGRFLTGWFSYDYELYSRGHGGYEEEYQQGHDQYRVDEGYYFDVDYDSEPVRREKPGRSSAQVIYPPRSRIRWNIDLHTPEGFGPKLWGIHPLGDWRANLSFSWTEGIKFTYNPEALPYVEENMQWKGYHKTDLKLSKRVQFKFVAATFYLEVYNLFNTKNFNMINYFGSPSQEGTPMPEPQKIYYDSIIENGYQPGDMDKPGIILPWGPEHALYFPRRDIFFGILFHFN
jgi:outer membrane receptor protein involved in Fe transport